MPIEWIIGLIFLSSAGAVFCALVASLWIDSDHKKLQEHGRAKREFEHYMRVLEEEEAGEEIFETFETLRQEHANERLKRSLYQHNLISEDQL